MSMLPRMRPSFAIRLSVPGDQVLELLRKRLADDHAPFEGQIKGTHACIRMHEARRTLLSPYLELEVIEKDGIEILHGRFSPQPNVWTGFMALFGVIAMLGLAGVVYGLARMMLGDGALWLLSGPAAVALIAFVHGAAFIGQGLSTDEMFVLRNYIQNLARELEASDGRNGSG